MPLGASRLTPEYFYEDEEAGAAQIWRSRDGTCWKKRSLFTFGGHRPSGLFRAPIIAEEG